MANGTTTVGELPVEVAKAPNQWLVIGASSLGTVFEWYDFYLYGLLAGVISAQFFSGVNEVTGFIFALAAFAAGFAVRPFGALVFGRLGDLVGRKYTFIVTMSIMGGATFLVGLLPNYASVGVAAPIALVALRLLQGPGARRRIRRRCHLRCRTRAAWEARALHQLDSNHGHPRIVCRAARRDRQSPHARRSGLQGLGLAHSLPDLARAVGRLALDTHAVVREPRVSST